MQLSVEGMRQCGNNENVWASAKQIECTVWSVSRTSFQLRLLNISAGTNCEREVGTDALRVAHEAQSHMGNESTWNLLRTNNRIAFFIR